MKQIRKRLTYANVMSSIAVFLVIGGGAAFAATQLPKNSVGSPQIKKNAVKTGDIAPNAVRTGKLAPEAAKAGKIAKNAIVTNRLRDDAVATSKIQNDAVTGDKVLESSLGQVPNATNATNGAPFAYAGVSAVGTLSTGYAAKNISNENITHPATGVYCFQLSFTPATASANAQAQAAEDGILSVDLVSPFPTCPANVQAEIRNYDASDGADQNDSFIVQFDK